MARVQIPFATQDAVGNVLGGTLVMYDRGTTDEAPVYSTPAGGIALPQPYVFAADDLHNLWADEGSYDLVLTTSSGTEPISWDAVAYHDDYMTAGDPAGGVLAGTYPNPSFAVDMATQAELDAKPVVQAPTSAPYTTASLATNANEVGVIAMYRGWRVTRVTTDRAARVRLYTSTTKRDNDLARPVSTDPPDFPTTGATPDHGCSLEVVTDATHLDLPMTPNVLGNTAAGSDNVPITVTNLAATSTVTVTVYYQRIDP